VNKIIAKEVQQMNGSAVPVRREPMSKSYDNMVELFVKDIAQKLQTHARETWV